MYILVINPGGTSTKIAVFNGKNEVFKENIIHDTEKIHEFKSVFDEFPYRMSVILDVLKKHSFNPENLSAAVGRGGLMRPIEGGTYFVNDAMIEDMKQQKYGEHASNLGAVLAKEFGDKFQIPAFVVDPVSVDEFSEIAKISGIKELERPSWMHALNQKAVCRTVAEKLGGTYADFNFIVAHLGSGISVALHKKGIMLDGSGGRSNGPFSPERSGGLPTYPLIELCYSGKYTREEMVKKVSSHGGMYSYLGTKDVAKVEKKAEEGNAVFQCILEAFWYQIAKEIASYAPAAEGKIDRIILTGGISRSQKLCAYMKKHLEFLAPIEIVAGELEIEALALGAYRVLSGIEKAKTY